MSWSVSARGTKSTVKETLESQFNAYTCLEPEESVKKAAAVLINAALDAQSEDQEVTVTASGSQGFKNWETKEGVYNTLTISVTPHFVSTE